MHATIPAATIYYPSPARPPAPPRPADLNPPCRDWTLLYRAAEGLRDRTPDTDTRHVTAAALCVTLDVQDRMRRRGTAVLAESLWESTMVMAARLCGRWN